MEKKNLGYYIGIVTFPILPIFLLLMVGEYSFNRTSEISETLFALWILIMFTTIFFDTVNWRDGVNKFIKNGNKK